MVGDCHFLSREEQERRRSYLSMFVTRDTCGLIPVLRIQVMGILTLNLSVVDLSVFNRLCRKESTCSSEH